MNSKKKYSPKIFFIGYNKTATTSFHRFFLDNNYRSYHNKKSKKNLTLILKNNFKNSLPILYSIDDAYCYSDLMYVDEFLYIEGHKYFKEIYKEYPDSYYILQTRNLDDWVNSRLNHNGKNNLLERTQLSLNYFTAEQVINFWKKDRELHEKSVINFFSNKKNFLKFNIDTDNIETLISFLEKDFLLDCSKWRKHNVT